MVLSVTVVLIGVEEFVPSLTSQEMVRAVVVGLLEMLL